jgi:hypothetical protein
LRGIGCRPNRARLGRIVLQCAETGCDSAKP